MRSVTTWVLEYALPFLCFLSGLANVVGHGLAVSAYKFRTPVPDRVLDLREIGGKMNWTAHISHFLHLDRMTARCRNIS